MPAVRPAAVVPALLLAGLIGVAAGCGGDDEDERPEPQVPPPAATETEPPAPRAEERRLARSEGGPRVETIATGLDIPWEIAFLPDGRALITERPGTVRLLSRDHRLRAQPVARVEVNAIGEGGLLGAAVDPDFERNRFVYLYRTTTSGNEVTRYRLAGDRLREDVTIVSGITAGAIHDGGRIHFGPDGRLYFTTGEAGDDTLAQDRGSLSGKILRMSPGGYRGDGARPEVVSLGHRNPQGLDWQPRTGRLIATEHGPDGDDEVNLIRQGRNYGWPEVRGADHGSFTPPLAVYADTIAPSGASFVSLPGSEWTGDYLIGALVGEQIRRLSFDGARVTRNEALFEGEFGRVRTVVEGPDGALYALTSNTDGRGSPRDGDDRLLRIVPPAG
jgi:glucose/arabinose dehydrogenase